jgi:hypothetical protein
MPCRLQVFCLISSLLLCGVICDGQSGMGSAKLIRKISISHCKKGPQRCAKCREMNEGKYCLLEIMPPGNAQRRVIELEVNGQKVWREFEAIKVFASIDEARQYAADHHIHDAKWEDDPGKAIDWKEDQALLKLSQSLPAGWAVSSDESHVMIQRSEPVWIMCENRINAPVSRQTEEERIAQIKEIGVQTYPKFVFRLEKKWTSEEMITALKKNRQIQEEMNQLPEQYGIANLLDKFLSSKGEPAYIANSAEETARIEKYNIEKARLGKEWVEIPGYTSQKYSLFLERLEGDADELSTAYPDVTNEIGGIKEDLATSCPPNF